MHLLKRTTGTLCVILLLAGIACHREARRSSGFVDVPGGRVAFRVIGKGDGIRLLMIHGGPGGRSCTYASTMKGVAASRPAVIYDQLDTGYSDRMLNLERDLCPMLLHPPCETVRKVKTPNFSWKNEGGPTSQVVEKERLMGA